MPTTLQTRLHQALERRPRQGLPRAAFWLALWFLLTGLLTLIPGSVGTLFQVLQVLIAVALAAIAIPLLVRFIRSRMLWSLRNKLVVTYLLIGLAPVVLFVTLATIASYIAGGQFAIHLADTRLEAELDRMATSNAVRTARVVRIVDDTPHGPDPALKSRIDEIGATERSAADGQRVRLTTHVETFLDGAPVPQPDAAAALGTPLGLPAWATTLPRGTFRGLVLDDNELFLVSIRQQRLHNGRLFTMLSSIPADSNLMDLVADGLGRARLFTQKPSPGQPAQPRRGRARLSSISGGNEPPPVSLADLRVRFLSTLDIVDWDTAAPDSIPIEVVSRPSLLYLQLFGASITGIVTSAYRTVFLSLALLFAAIEALALFMAVRLSRTMTTSVADLYTATLHIDRGDLTHRIAVSRTDQLAELSRSFNRMTGSLGRLLDEQKEKERLQNELSIAQEVQANLFPTAVRDLPTLELHGICRPARSVSGDYYDFLVFYDQQRKESGVGIALGDISGKGISAALLMATLHSAVRAYQFASEAVGTSPSAKPAPHNAAEALFSSPGRIMALLNRHLYRSTQPEKYATLFLAHYEAATAWLTYSTAGQLPPLLLGRDGSIRRLDCGGTVVGLMDNMAYEEGRLPMHPGDILVAYSDGVTEPENDFGDFGEDRLMEVVRRFQGEPLHIISREVMAALDDWIGAEEQPDDITLVLARQR